MATGFENLTLLLTGNINGIGNAVANIITGNAGANTLSRAAAGNDTHRIGGAGNDTLVGGLGKDTMTGSTGADKFDFNLHDRKRAGRQPRCHRSTSSAPRATRSTFRPSTPTPTAPRAIRPSRSSATGAFTGVDGQLRCSAGIVQGDVNGDRVADFEIKVNLATLLATDFVL